MAEFLFSKIPCFRRACLNTFRRMHLKYEKYSYFRHSNSSQTTKISLQKLFMKHIKNEGCNCYLSNKKQKAIFPSCFSIGCALFLCARFCFWRVPLVAQVKLHVRKIGRVEANISTIFHKIFETNSSFRVK